MKKVIAMLALVALTGNIASAELLKNFKYDGKIIVNAINANNSIDMDSDAKDKLSDVDTYVELNAGFNLAEDVDATVTAIKANRQHGDNAETVANGTIDQFKFEQAYLNLKGILGIDHKVGRQFYGTEGDLVIYAGPKSMMMDLGGAPGNALSATGIDAWTGWYKNEKLAIHAIVAKLENDNNDDGVAAPNTARIADTDSDLTGIVAKYDLMEVLNLGAYVYENKENQAAAPSLTTDVVGLKANGKILGFDYKAELAKNYGRQAAGKNYTGTAFLASAKYDITMAGKWTFMGEFGMGSGDDKTYAADKDVNEFTSLATDYRPGIIWGGVFANSDGLADLTTWNLGAKWNTPMFEKLTLGGKLYYFAPTVTKVNSTAAGAAKTDIGYDAFGSELDLCANWQHSENVGLKAYYAMFMVDSDFADTMLAGKDDMATAMGVAVSVKF